MASLPNDVDVVEELLDDLPAELKAADPLMGMKIRRLIDDQYFTGVVENSEKGQVSGERLYKVRYSDGDLEHLTAKQVMEIQDKGSEDDLTEDAAAVPAQVAEKSANKHAAKKPVGAEAVPTDEKEAEEKEAAYRTRSRALCIETVSAITGEFEQSAGAMASRLEDDVRKRNEIRDHLRDRALSAETVEVATGSVQTRSDQINRKKARQAFTDSNNAFKETATRLMAMKGESDVELKSLLNYLESRVALVAKLEEHHVHLAGIFKELRTKQDGDIMKVRDEIAKFKGAELSLCKDIQQDIDERLACTSRLALQTEGERKANIKIVQEELGELRAQEAKHFMADDSPTKNPTFASLLLRVQDAEERLAHLEQDKDEDHSLAQLKRQFHASIKQEQEDMERPVKCRRMSFFSSFLRLAA